MTAKGRTERRTETGPWSRSSFSVTGWAQPRRAGPAPGRPSRLRQTVAKAAASPILPLAPGHRAGAGGGSVAPAPAVLSQLRVQPDPARAALRTACAHRPRQRVQRVWEPRGPSGVPRVGLDEAISHCVCQALLGRLGHPRLVLVLGKH